jgi:hypothetical protein
MRLEYLQREISNFYPLLAQIPEEMAHMLLGSDIFYQVETKRLPRKAAS